MSSKSKANLFVAFVALFCLPDMQSVKAADFNLGVFQPKETCCPTLKEFSGEPINVGCFDSEMGVFHPLMPEEIDAIYSLYRYNNISSRYRRFRYDESLDGEQDHLFEPNDQLAMIIHGFTDNVNRPWMAQMKDALFLRNDAKNLKVILVDWHKGSEGIRYDRAARNVVMLARISAELLYRLMKRYTLQEKTIHLIGHSLGGQTVAMMASWLFEKHSIKIGRVTGLDVASPLFAELHIVPNKSHAHFFESVHTSSGDSIIQGKFGLKNAFSHLDIYPNGGVVPQPGCVLPPTTVHCSHDLSRPFYSQLLIICNSGCSFNVTNCNSSNQANLKACSGTEVDICSRMKYLAENATDEDAEIVYFETNQDEIVSSCNKNWNTTLVKSMDDIVTLVKTGIQPNVY